MIYRTRTTCRLCYGELEDIINLGDIYLNTFLNTDEVLPPKAPLDMVRCKRCNLVQLRDTVNFDAMYRDYWYKSSLNKQMIAALKDVVDKACMHTTLKPWDIVLDIGSNDGTLLSNYPADIVKVGFEPSNVGNDLQEPNHIFHTYFNAKDFLHRYRDKARIITAIAMFYDLEDPHAFVEDVKRVLHDDGVFVIQMMDLRSMLENSDFPNLCHEHLEYYSLRTLSHLLISHGLQITDLEYNGVNGGSLRVYAKHIQPVSNKNVDAELAKEDAFFAQQDQFTAFKERIEIVKKKIVEAINDINMLGSNVAVLGASTKGNTMLQYFGLTDRDITHAAEVNPDKFGRRTVGSNIPIISQEESLAINPNYYLILPYGFIDIFVKNHMDYLLAGGRFIVPLPTPRIINADKERGVWEILL